MVMPEPAKTKEKVTCPGFPLVPDLSSDRPISSLSEDLLGRGGFAVALANAFIEWKGKDSLVVALYGTVG